MTQHLFTSTPLLLVIIVVFIAIVGGLAVKPKSKKLAPLGDINVSKRRPLSAYEEQMFYTLSGALPGCIVLAQVAFSSLITTKSHATRNRFDRKVADFVVCSKQLTPIAIIELDDASHKGKEKQDADRDAMLKKAGYTTLRYTGIPAAHQVQRDIAALELAQPVTPASARSASVHT